MIAILKDVRMLEKEIKQDRDNNDVYIFSCYQRGSKDLIQVKGIPQDVYSRIQEEEKITLEVRLMAWGQNNNYGLSVKFVDIVETKNIK